MSLKLLEIGPANKLSIFLSASPRDYSSTRQLSVAFLKAIAIGHRKICSTFSFLTLWTTNLGRETCHRKRHLQSSTRYTRKYWTTHWSTLKILKTRLTSQTR